MENTELCGRCKNNGKENCFKKRVEEIVLDVKEENLDKALEAHDKISQARIKARENGCFNLNNIDPYYLGKNLL